MPVSSAMMQQLARIALMLTQRNYHVIAYVNLFVHVSFGHHQPMR